MAKKQITPQLFRAGITQHWPTAVKLENYLNNYAQLDAAQSHITDFWYNKTLRKLLLKCRFVKRKRLKITENFFVRRFFKRFNRHVFIQIIKKKIEMRRRVLLFRIIAGRALSRFRSRKRRRSRLSHRMNYWYSKKKNRRWLQKQKIHNYASYKQQQTYKNWRLAVRRLRRNEKRKVWFRNYAHLTFLNLQSGLDYYVRFSMDEARTSLGGSTALRAYQSHIIGLQPPRWTGCIRVKRESVKKMAGFILRGPKRPRITRRHLVTFSQINLALHWRSSELFIDLIKTMLLQYRYIQGSVRLIHDVLQRLYLWRINIRCIKMRLTGSFGKLTRSKSMHLGRFPPEVSRSVTNLNQSVSYAYSQVWTVRGVLGLRVWIFW